MQLKLLQVLVQLLMMLMRVATLLFFFLIHLFKLIRKFETVDFKLKKTTLDLDFLSYCCSNFLIPIFLKFKLANKTLANFDVFKLCQQKLLIAGIEEKKKIIDEHKSHHYKLLIKIKQQVNPIDFGNTSSIFLICYDKNILLVTVTNLYQSKF